MLASLSHPSHILMYAHGMTQFAAYLQLKLFRVYESRDISGDSTRINKAAQLNIHLLMTMI